MKIKYYAAIVTLVVILLTTEMVLASHFEAAFITREPCWAFHPNASLTCDHQDQHHTHGLIVFEKIHGVSEHLPIFVVRSKGVYGSIRDRTIQLAEKMDLAMDMITEGGELTIAVDGNNYAVFVERGHSKLRVMTVTPGDAQGYTQRSDPESWGNLTTRQLADHIVEYWMDMYFVFYRMQEPEYLRDTEQGNQIIGMINWARIMARNDGVNLSVETLHEYIDTMPGSRAFKKELESLAYKMPDPHGAGDHGYEPQGH